MTHTINLHLNYRLFTWATILWIGICLLITGLMQLSNDLAVYLWYCLPGVLVFLMIPFFVCWKKDILFMVAIMVNFFIILLTSSIFFSIYFSIFHPSHHFTFEKVENCSIIGQMNANLLGAENYSVLYVDLKYNNENLLGYGCRSNQNEEYVINSISSFSFYERNEQYTCGPISKGDSYQIPSRRTLSNSRIRLLKTSMSQGNRCRTTYTFSNVKLPSWMCLSKQENLVTDPQTCYISLYKNDALNTAKKRTALRNASSFAMITFNKDIYFSKGGFMCLVVFAYLPMLTSLHLVCAVICHKISSSVCPSNQTEKPELEDQNKPAKKQAKNVLTMLNNHRTPSYANSHHLNQYAHALDKSIDEQNVSIQMQKGSQNLMKVDLPHSNRNQIVSPVIQSYNQDANIL